MNEETPDTPPQDASVSEGGPNPENTSPENTGPENSGSENTVEQDRGDQKAYAIIADGGRQYRVEEGQQLDVDYREVAKGSELQFQSVLAVSGEDGMRLGKPVVDGASVTAEVLGVRLGEKISVQKLRRRKNSRRRTGHRQMYTTVRISKISC